MPEGRERPAEGAIEEDLLRRVREMVIAADHVGNRGLGIVGDHGEIVHGRPIGTEDDEVIDRSGGKRHRPVDHVLPLDRLPRHPNPEGEGLLRIGPRARDGRVQPPAAAVVPVSRPHSFRLLASGRECLGSAETPVGGTLAEQAQGVPPVALDPVRLERGTFVKLQTQPREPVQDGLRVLRPGTRPIRVLHAQEERPARAPREQPVEQRRARAAHMQETGGAGGEPHPYRHERSSSVRDFSCTGDFSRDRDVDCSILYGRPIGCHA